MSLILKNKGMFPLGNPLVDEFLTNDLLDWDGRNIATIGTTLPSVNILESAKEINIELAAPGLKKGDFNIELDENNILSISAEHTEEKHEKGKKGEFTRKEYNYESFLRTFSLPDYSNNDKIDANYKDGILHVTIAKKQKATPKATKSISIK